MKELIYIGSKSIKNAIIQLSHRVQDAMIEDLQRQVTELTQRLPAQDFEDREAFDHYFNSTFENPYHNRALFWEHYDREEHHGDLNFWVDLPEFSGMLQVEGFVDWIDEVESIFYYKEFPDHVKVKLNAIKLRAEHLHGGSSCDVHEASRARPRSLIGRR
ncbi:hypothetical protein I3843_06G054200 [Carya illinoinensis]|nr:hypothetical protein I3843_06G054200 [Carya illinoinensis]